MNANKQVFKLAACILAGLTGFSLFASEHHGQVKFGGLPVPGATVTATQGEKKLAVITDPQGVYSFPDLADGTWSIEVEMLGFQAMKQDVGVAASASPSDFELKMLALDAMNAVKAEPAPASAAPAPAAASRTTARGTTAKGGPPPPSQNTRTGFQRTDVNAAASAPADPPAQDSDALPTASSPELNQRAADGFLINGTANNGASSNFALPAAFGNNRRGPRSLYNGNLGFILDNSSWDARQFSITGQNTPKPAYNRFTGVAAFGGPIKIPHLLRNGPNFNVTYQWTRNRNATSQPGLMPTEAERRGDFSQAVSPLGKPLQIIDPSNGLPFIGNVIPPGSISPQARALLQLYPLPNFNGSTSYNYQVPLVSVTHQDSLQSRANKPVGRKNQLSGNFGYQSIRADNPNLFDFLDTSATAGINATASWRHSFTPRFFGTLSYQFSRQSVRIRPFFSNRENISGQAGISGNNQEPVNWGPPSLSFASGITGLSDAVPSFNRNQTGAVSYDSLWNRGRHNVSFGADFRRQQFNYFSQDNPRGSFTFTGAAAGSDFAGFLLGVPDTSSIAFGNADKYFRASSYDGYVTDDWRMSPSLTINAGVRWEYWSPITELYGRLVNLDVAPGFTAVAPVVARSPIGPLTGLSYPDSLVQPDKHAFQPRIGLSWRPFPASSMVVRAGYGVYYNTSVYQSIAAQMAQQSPLSKGLSVQNTPAAPLSLANGFNAPPGITLNTFAIDPNFRVGYAQNWQVSIQRDLPAALQMTATYLGIKGTRGAQEFLPNTFPSGDMNPCLTCPTGFAYMTSNGNSTRESGTVQLRRRLHNGFTATVQYTFSKSIDDSALGGGKGQGGPLIAQNWLDLGAERGLSSFDQRHLVNLQAQYTTGMGIGGGTLVNGWRSVLLKEWTIVSQITAGTGLPLTPIYYGAAVKGTGFTGSLRPDYTGASVYEAPAGRALNLAAYALPATGQWGNAGRNSITGPSQFSLNASLGRTFRMSDRLSLDVRVDAANALNHVTFPSWITNVTSTQFGLPPNQANPMRSLQTTVRMRF